MKYELTIDATYLDGNRWNPEAGIREFMQNGRDAEIEQSAPLTVDWKASKDDSDIGTLRIENEGAILPRDALLFGRSTKRDNQELAGKWGEGLKLGALVLVRNGYPVTIRNGGEVWTPTIEPSEKFEGRPVLVFNIASGRAERNRVRVEIENISRDMWENVRDRFLFLYKRDIPSVKTHKGTLLLTDKWQGRIYVKGILVQTDSALEYGYDLADAELDRDRCIVESYDLRSRIRGIWTDVLSTRPDLFDSFGSMLENRAKDVEGVDCNWYAEALPEEARQAVAAKFIARHGDKAIPISNNAESLDFEHLGVKGIVVPPAMAYVLATVVGKPEDVKERLRNEATSYVSWCELEPEEKANLSKAVELVNKVDKVDLSTIEIAHFRSDGLLGQYKDGQVILARKILGTIRLTLETLVHEVAHTQGADGDKAHVTRIEYIWSGIAAHLMGTN